MHEFHIKKQIIKLYLLTFVRYFQIAGASWVVLLSLRGFSLFEIGVLESIFHIVSFCFEIPSGIFADVFGRKKTLVISQIVALLSSIGMILSENFWTISFSISLNALSYNLDSGTREALAYDSLKKSGTEEAYTDYASTETMLYRITNSTATLCAGFALWIGYKKAYAIDAILLIAAIFITRSLVEVRANGSTHSQRPVQSLKNIITESTRFLVFHKHARSLMLISSLVSAVSILVLFFLQAKLPMAGLNNTMLGPVLFIIGLGAALGAKLVSYFPNSSYRFIVLICSTGVIFSFGMTFTGSLLFMATGGFVGACCDNFLSVKTDILLNRMIPSEQRATLVSVNSFLFSIIMIVLSAPVGWIMG